LTSTSRGVRVIGVHQGVSVSVSRRWLFAITCVGALVVTMVALAAGSQTFIDPTGDAGAAPDITTVVVSNDDNGVVTFAVTLANPALLTGDAVIAAFLNTDKNLTTGRQGDGSEFVILFDGTDLGLFRWNGTTFAPVQATTLTRRSATTIAINRQELGATAAFDFYLIAAGPEPAQDEAPNGTAVWSYQLQLRPEIDSVSARFNPAAPRSGALFSVSSVVLRLEGGQNVAPTSFSCRARLGTSTLAPSGNCRWRIPKKSKGKKLAITITASYQGDSAKFLPYTFTVR